MADILFAEQTLSFTKNTGDDIYCANTGDTPVILTAGDSYTVSWDGSEYVCVAESHTLGSGLEAVAIGNKSIEGLGEDSGEPFLIGYAEEYAATVFETLDTAETHVVAIYSGVKEEEPEEQPEETPVEEKNSANIVLYDRNGNPVTYGDIETVTFNTDVDEVTATYTFGTAVNDVPVDLDLSDGDQTVKATAGELIKSAVVKKPETLVPENIKKGVEVAGVVGELIGISVTKEVELDLSDGDQTVQADEDTLMSKVIIKKPDELVPENIAADVSIAGVVGTMVGGGVPVRDIAERTLSGAIEDSTVTSVYTGAFKRMSLITEVSFPNCSLIDASAFFSCFGMESASFPNASNVYADAFGCCSKLKQITLGCTSDFYTLLPTGVFSGCVELSEIKYMYSSSYVDAYAVASNGRTFENCQNLKSIKLLGKGGAYGTNYCGIGASCFQSCYKLSSFEMSGSIGTMRTAASQVSTNLDIGSSAFRHCSELTKLSFNIVAYNGFGVGASAFEGCSKLQDIWLNFTSIPTSSSSQWFYLGASAFAGTPMSSSGLTGKFGSIHVTSNAYTYLKNATGWKSYSARMVSY